MPVFDADAPTPLLEIAITEKMLSWAHNKEQKFKEGQHYNHDFVFDGNRLTGYVAESAFWKHYPKAIYRDASKYDFKFLEKLWDIKSYKSDYAPQPDYGVCVTHKDLTERGGIANYFWVTVASDYSKATLLGWLSFEEFAGIAVFKKKGDKLGNFEYPCDTWEVPILSLSPPMSGNEVEQAPPPLCEKLNDPKYDRIKAMPWPEYSADLVSRQRAELQGRKK